MKSGLPRGRQLAAIACVLAGLFAVPAYGEISQSASAREYAGRLAKELDKVMEERDAALEALEAERKKAKQAVERTVGKAVAREAVLAEARRRIEALEAKLASAISEHERLSAQIEGLVGSREQADRDHAKRETELVERARTADLDRAEAERLESEARREIEEARTKARNDVEEAQAKARAETERLQIELADARRETEQARENARVESGRLEEAAAVHARELGDLQGHILDLEGQLAKETESRLALQSHGLDVSESAASQGDSGRVAALEKELETKRVELSELEKRSAGDRKELRALRATREDLERELDAVRREPGTETVANEALPEWAVEEAEPEELQRLLALERERRATLEGELVRLSATGDVAERYRESWQALQAARADLLLLSERLSAEQQRREDLEALLDRAQAVAAKRGESENAPLGRLIDVASQHGRDTEKLETELRQANDQLTRLRGYLETVESPEGGGAAVVKLDEENAKLKSTLQAAEKTIGRLSSKAALAERLAELVYTRRP